jgi:hypothetical protein
LRRAVEKYIEDNLAEALLAGNLKKSNPIHVIVSDDEDEGLTFEQTGKAGKKDSTPVSSATSDEDFADS